MIVKICGLAGVEDAMAACVAGADMIGVIVDTPVLRSVAPDRASEILGVAPKSVARVAGMVPRDVSHAIKIAQELKPDYLQIHAEMPQTQLLEIREGAGVPLIAVVAVPREGAKLEEVLKRAREVAEVADYVLVDTKHAGVGGGTGLTHDWGVSRAVRDAISKPLILAGGLNPKNVAEAMRTVRPHGVDVASGVESSFGKKDPALMRAFVKAARRAFGVRR